MVSIGSQKDAIMREEADVESKSLSEAKKSSKKKKKQV
jgi:hypothetical protein